MEKNIKKIKKKENKEDYAKDNKMSCPVCGNPIKLKILDTSDCSTDMASFVCQCWSGDIMNMGEEHMFRLRIYNIPYKEIILDGERG